MQVSLLVCRNLLPSPCSLDKETIKSNLTEEMIRGPLTYLKTNVKITYLIGSASLLTFILDFFFGGNFVEPPTHPFIKEEYDL